MDIISNIPTAIIETILCLLPIQEAARTSILSTEWRYHWTKIPNLVFIEDTFPVSDDNDGAEPSVLELAFDQPSQRKVMTTRCKLFYAIFQVLLMHEGPIQEFTLSMDVDGSCVEIDHILLYLSKKYAVKYLKLDLTGQYKLPLSFFSLHQLKDLYLCNCTLYCQPSFSGFRSLTNLYVGFLWTCEKTLLRLLSSCPLLKELTLNSDSDTIDVSGESTVADLFECLPAIEYLCVWFYVVLCFNPERLPKELPTALVHLKYLCMECVCFRHKYGLPFLCLLIKSSPNLEKLYIEVVGEDWLGQHDFGSFKLEVYQDITLEHLSKLEITYFHNMEIELDFVKFILAKSPVLKKLRIFLSDELGKDEELQILKILSSSPCASPVVEIIVRHWDSS